MNGVEAQAWTCDNIKPQVAGAGVAGRSWLAVFVNSHHEKRVSQHLTQRRLESFLPLYSEVHRWTNRRKATVELPLFPNYIFVRIERGQRAQVLSIPGVLSIVGCGCEPAQLPDHEIELLRSRIHLCHFKPHPYLTVGQQVRMKAGAMEGMEGILLREKNDVRVVISLNLIQRSVAVEVDAKDVEPVRARGNC